MKELNIAYQHLIQKQLADHQISGHLIDTYLTHTTFRNRLSPLYIPKVFDADTIARFRAICATTYAICLKVIDHYQKDEAYRACFPFSSELQELICLPAGIASPMPMARFDIFYNEETGDFKFCEINTDGTSAMNEVRELYNSLHSNLAQRIMDDAHHFKRFVLIDTWIDRMMALYAGFPGHVRQPAVAITDFIPDVSANSLAEFDEFKRHFTAKGLKATICDVRAFTFNGGVLRGPDRTPVDIVYRRAVTSDLMAHYHEITPFLDAVRQGAVCLMGPLASQVPHNKWFFHMLWDPATSAFLTADEQRFVRDHFPRTELLTEENIAALDAVATKDRWIIKPLDSYASKGVYAGIDASPARWQKLLTQRLGTGTIIQAYCPPYQSTNIDFSEAHPVFRKYTNMTGLYVFAGRFAGIYSRLSNGGIISSQYNECVVPTLVLAD